MQSPRPLSGVNSAIICIQTSYIANTEVTIVQVTITGPMLIIPKATDVVGWQQITNTSLEVEEMVSLDTTMKTEMV